MVVENALRMVDHGALTRDGIHLNTQPRIQWINDAFQTRIEEMEAELRTRVKAVKRGSPAGRVRSHVLQPLANGLGPLATEANMVQPTPSSDVRERSGTAPAPRRRSLENRHETRGSPPQVDPQATTSNATQPSRTPPAQRISQADPAVVIDTIKVSELLRNRADPSPWGQYKADMAIKLYMKKLTCHADSKKMLNGHDPTVFGLYRIAGVDRLLTEEEQFSSATTLPLADLHGLPWDNTMVPLKKISLTDVRHQVTERAPTNRKGKLLVENKPNNRHHKMCRQFAKPPRQSAVEYLRDYPRVSWVEGDERRYAHLESPNGDSLFAANDPQEMKLGKILIVASSDYLYTPRSLFWVDVIFLTSPNLDWGQMVGMAISVQRLVNVDPEVVIIAGSNDHLQSRELLNALIDGSTTSLEAVGEAIMTLLSAMTEAKKSIRQCFERQLVKVIFVLSPSDASLPKPLQIVYAMVVLLAEGQFDVMISAPNRQVDPKLYYPFRSVLPAIWSHTSNAIQGFKDHSTTRVVLDERLGLELSKFGRLLKMRRGVGDEHRLVQPLKTWWGETPSQQKKTLK